MYFRRIQIKSKWSIIYRSRSQQEDSVMGETPKNTQKIGCLIPCYRGSAITLSLIDKALNFTDYVILIDDACPNQTGRLVEKEFTRNDKVKVIFNSYNQGVGKSCQDGIRFLLENNCTIVIKIDADGQMDPNLIPRLIQPIVEGKAEAVKGNRFTCVDDFLSMPKIRIIGNLVLSFLNKISTGYWELFDPTNGFIAFKSSALKRVRLEKTDNRYFFESDLLFQCALAQITFAQLPMQSIYGNEISSLKPSREISKFAKKHLINFLKRLVYQYFVLDFNAGSLELLGGLIGIFLTSIFSLKIIISGVVSSTYATPGQSAIFAVMSIITLQLFIGFIYYDSTQQPLLRHIRQGK